jgi:spermidine synthase
VAGPVRQDEGVSEVRTLASATSPRGEILLRVRAGDAGEVVELVVNGVFAMDSAETSSEEALATLVPAWASRVLVGGLGLGYTPGALLDRTELPLERLDVVELEPCLVGWAGARLTRPLARLAADPRVGLHVGDVAAVLAGTLPPPGPWDAILLDVDNGPDFLIHDANAALYGATLLGEATARLAPGGLLAVWCQGPAPDLLATLSTLGPAREHRYRVDRGRRTFSYVVYTVERTPDRPGQNGPHG